MKSSLPSLPPLVLPCLLFIAVVIACVACGAGQSHAQHSRFDELANAAFEENRPTAESAQMLRDELLFQRATQAYLWALPLMTALNRTWKPGDIEKVKRHHTPAC